MLYKFMPFLYIIMFLFFQAYKPGQVLDASGPIIRKKRSFKRHSCQNGGGKQMCFSEGMSFKKDPSFD